MAGDGGEDERVGGEEKTGQTYISEEEKYHIAQEERVDAQVSETAECPP